MIPAVSAGPTDISKVRCHISISLDGFVAGPNQSLDNPLGEGGERLHEWAFATEGWSRPTAPVSASTAAIVPFAESERQMTAVYSELPA